MPNLFTSLNKYVNILPITEKNYLDNINKVIIITERIIDTELIHADNSVFPFSLCV